MGSRGKNSPNSLCYIAERLDTGLRVEFKGIRAFCRSMWGENPDGTPKNITRAIDMSNGKRGVTEVKGWIIRKASNTSNPIPVLNTKDPIGDYLKSLTY